MSGEPEKVVRMEPKAAPGVFNRGGLGARVAALESRMGTVEASIKSAAELASVAAANAKLAADNTSELLAVANATKSIAGFVRKHGPKAISFGAGIMTILGVGNPQLWKYIGTFFGG
jgi:hypothetical protein